jgi:hypothetical protein
MLKTNQIVVIALLAFVLLCACLTMDLALGVVVWQTRSSVVQPTPTVVGQPRPLPTPVPDFFFPLATPAPAEPTPEGRAGSESPKVATPSATGSPTAPMPADHSATLRALSEAQIPDRDLYRLAEQLKKLPGPIRQTVTDQPRLYKVGDRDIFWVSDQSKKQYFRVIAELRYATPHVYVWVEQGVNVSDADLKKSADVFENKIYPTNRRYSGSEWTPGIDADPHLFILHARGMGQGVGGYYSSADEYPREIDPYSNEHEMFYINVEAYRPGTATYEGVLAHEFQHMIHWNEDKSEEVWVNEGLAELAAVLNGYDGDRATTLFTANPDVQLNAWAEDPLQAAPHYGNAYLFTQYCVQRFGAGLMRAVVAEPADGRDGYEKVLEQHADGQTFDDVFRDWVIANYLDDPKLDDGRYGYTDLTVHASPVARIQRTPDEWQDAVHQYAADYVELLPSGSPTVTVTFQGSLTVPLIAGLVHSGRYAWWANRSDGGDTTLTRPFDLTGVTGATLKFWTWYDIEADWDYAYVEASTDNGKTWDMLPGRYTTTTNPNGNNFGNAWTGQSVGATTSLRSVQALSGRPTTHGPEWVEEQVDLTPYAGQQVLLRFEYITDDALNTPGWLIDDIRIPEINYRDDAEAGDGGWLAQGFVRSDNVLPQRWLVQVIELGQQTGVRTLPVGPDGRGAVTIGGLGTRLNRAVVVISALAPKTTEVGWYRLEVQAGGEA